MKTLILSISIVLTGTITAIGQNYIGMDQSTILRKFGEPNEKGDNYFVYNPVGEEGTNVYYFNENKNCVLFLINRANKYFDNYQNMLEKEFTKTDANKYVRTSKKYHFLAEITKSQHEFQIRIQYLDANPVKEICYEN